LEKEISGKREKTSLKMSRARDIKTGKPQRSQKNSCRWEKKSGGAREEGDKPKKTGEVPPTKKGANIG